MTSSGAQSGLSGRAAFRPLAGIGPARTTLLALLAAAFLVLAGLVHHGSLTAVDQYGIDHLTLDTPGTGSGFSLRSIFFPFHLDARARDLGFEAWTFPASALVSAAIVGLCSLTLLRRGQRAAALAWPAAWVAANVIEVVGKGALHRPALHATTDGERYLVRAVEQSFPSGHTLRALIAAAAVGYVWPRLLLPAVLWAVSAMVVLVVDAAHVVSDVAGGLLAASFLVVVAWTVADEDERSRGGGALRSSDRGPGAGAPGTPRAG